MRKLTEFSVNYPISVLMLVLCILLLGYISFDKLGMDLFPNLNNPRIFVEIKAGEKPPEEIEKQFVKSIESLAIRQKGVLQVASVTRAGSARITVSYRWDADMDAAFLDLQKALANFNQNNELDELNLSQHDPNTTPMILIGFSHPQIKDMDVLRQVAAGYIRNELTRQEGIAAIELIGVEEKEVVIETDPYQLAAHNLTLNTIATQVQSANLSASGGSVDEKGVRYIIKSVGAFESLEDIGDVIVGRSQASTETPGMAGNASTSAESAPIYLRDVADIFFRNKEPDNIVRINGVRSVALAIYKDTKYNTVLAAKNLNTSLEKIKEALPGYEFKIVQNQAVFIENAINEVEESALLGIILAIIVLYVFLRRIGATFVMSIAIPISIVATFNLMYFNDLTLNIMTLGGLALGAGMLVDNAIVVMENIFRHLENGASLKEAAIDGTAQVAGAITASTLTTIVVFLPIVYLHGAAGELFKEQAWTVAFSLLSSLGVAILFIPMLSHRFLKTDQQTSNAIHFDGYSKFLTRILDRRLIILATGAFLVVLGWLLIPVVGSEFIPKAESNQFRVNIRLEEGASLAHTDRAIHAIETLSQELLADDLESIYVQSGPSTGLLEEQGSVDEGQNTASLLFFLKPPPQRSVDEIITQLNTLFEGHPDLQAEFIRDESALQSTLGTEEAPLTIEVKGEDLLQLQTLTDSIASRLGAVPDILSWESSFDEGRPEINVFVDRIRAGIFDATMSDVSNQLKDQIDGREAGNWEDRGELRDISVKVPPPNVRDIGNLPVETAMGEIRLEDIAVIRQMIAPKEIHRKNQTRIGKVNIQLKGKMPLDQTVKEIRAALVDIPFPPNYRYEIGGEEEKRRDSFDSLKFALLLSIILIYMVLASQFESLVHPFTIILTIPLAAVGAILIFFFMGLPLNIMAYIGIIMLVGIAVNDSIILVDAINRLKWQGMPLREAIVAAGQQRIRPIIMTSLTTILALLPLTFGFGESASLRAPMALAVIGGLVTSTLLTLVVIPCAYYVLDRFSNSSANPLVDRS